MMQLASRLSSTGNVFGVAAVNCDDGGMSWFLCFTICAMGERFLKMLRGLYVLSALVAYYPYYILITHGINHSWIVTSEMLFALYLCYNKVLFLFIF